MATITFHWDQLLGKIKPLHSGGQPPLYGADATYFHYLTEAGTPYSRLHDVGGPYGGSRFVDVPNIFRDFDADENDPASYDFAFTDSLITALVEAGIEPYYRLGITIENNAATKHYRTEPPKDFAKWARICGQIIAHYTEGWANGFHYKITYWEIWNEADFSSFHENDPAGMMWCGTAEQYFQLYTVTATYLKKRFPQIKIGGYAATGFYAVTQQSDENDLPHYLLRFFERFFTYIREHQAPIDFFTWHSYSRTEETVRQQIWVEQKLQEWGYGNIEIHLNEWNPIYMEHCTPHHSAEVAGMMLAMQNRRMHVMCIYDLRLHGAYSAVFDGNTLRPSYSYYALVAFNQLYQLGTQVQLDIDTKELYAVAATNGKQHALLLSNLTGTKQELSFVGVEFPKNAHYYILAQDRLLSWAPNAKQIDENGVLLIEWEEA